MHQTINSDEPTKQKNLKIPVHLHRKLREIAFYEERSISAVAVDVIEAGLAAQSALRAS